MIHTEIISEKDKELEIRASVSHAPGSATGDISFYRDGVFIMSISRDSPKAKRWTWELPSRERLRWVVLANRVANRAKEIAERSRLSDKPI